MVPTMEKTPTVPPLSSFLYKRTLGSGWVLAGAGGSGGSGCLLAERLPLLRGDPHGSLSLPLPTGHPLASFKV